MLLALGAASSVIDAFKSLTQTKAKSSSPQATGFTQSSTNPFDSSSSTSTSASPAPASGPSGFSQISPSTMSALLAAQSQSSTATTTSSTSTSPSSALQDLFSQIDGNGDGQISKSEFESALGAGGTNTAQADDVFGKMDKNGDGSVSLDEMSSALKGPAARAATITIITSPVRMDRAARFDSSSTSGSSSDPLLQALDGATSTSTTNSDGSTTTSMTYADGSKVTMTTPASTSSSSATSSGSATSSYNIIEQMIQRQAQAISSGATSSLSMSV